MRKTYLTAFLAPVLAKDFGSLLIVDCCCRRFLGGVSYKDKIENERMGEEGGVPKFSFKFSSSLSSSLLLLITTYFFCR
jgi:hypothetical protein